MKQTFFTIFGIPIIHTDHKSFINTLENRIKSEHKSFVVTANPEIVMKANQEKEYAEYLKRADFITADGIGIVIASKILNQPLPGRVSGTDMMVDLLERANDHQYRVYFLGAQPDVLELFLENVHKQFPKVEIVGSHNGFFDWNDNTIKEEIQSLKPDLVFVALGVPRQEKWIAENYDSFQKGVFMGVGGSFDVVAGVVKRAPKAWQKMNLEWLYRLIHQPSRWKRMLVIPVFLFKVIGQKFRN
ncbi:WecB/TagA/CpsF family glycosyltransferase [Bacillus sp. FJAT-49736]|uniref:WecB/TagA/CpsF family glycosyltransferase n=1 Tax=Bacillus sp. FJAT-49736 TaxID=2833582 RepID=UPI001BC91BFB|nr:WecB/TagA/CpsF family glycosyltransferase [Bacillus sp. FJAT-49736]MBS4174181.1 WecB/TagA/CpsF family glycosyltransferase [Bacillus sp. FJAT-49736]